MPAMRYKAFISYSHENEREGDWLHHALETYRVPANLVGTRTSVGVAPARLTPIFRDREDLPAAGNLNATIIEALKTSEFLVVLASQAAAKSKWVNEEIRQFKAFHGPDRVLAVIIDGEPFATNRPDVADDLECFPEALRFHDFDDGTRTPAEPLAADARRGKDSKRYAITKLAAGLIGVQLDDLVQREAHRRTQRAWRLAAAAGAASTVLTAVAGYAWIQRDAATKMRIEAEARHEDAEDLIEFMISDFRSALDAVGRLDVFDEITDRTLAYYEEQDLRALSGDVRGRHARALLLKGESAIYRGDLLDAERFIVEAERKTRMLVDEFPDDAERLFDHAQSVYWRGELHLRNGQLTQSEARFREYLSLAEQMQRIDADNPKYRRELNYGFQNVAAALASRQAWEEALAFFVKARDTASQSLPNPAAPLDRARAIAPIDSWIASMLANLGRTDEALDYLNEEIALYDAILNESDDNGVRLSLAFAAKEKAMCLLAQGRIDDSASSLARARREFDRLDATDPANSLWKQYGAQILADSAMVSSHVGDIEAGRRFAERSRRLVASVQNAGEKTPTIMRLSAAAEIARLRLDRQAPPSANRREALKKSIDDLQSLSETGDADHKSVSMLAQARLALGDAYAAVDAVRAREHWSAALKTIT
ncbi:MAG: toll/interleukin-1 receptor domain-containing protein, partial [Pseudomonadota bacterium]